MTAGHPGPPRVGIFGGSFDPVHRGHLAPVEAVAARLGLDEVLYVPAYCPPHKPTGPSAPSHHRFAMLALALAPMPGFRLSDFEVAKGGTTYTVETLRQMRALRPDEEIVLVLGSDALVSFDKWRSWREIADGYRFAVIHREPFDYERTRDALPPELRTRMAPEGVLFDESPEEATIFWGGNAPVTISSTWLRRAIPAGEDLDGGLPPSVEAYVRRHRLYLGT
ncbi:MAG: nicotinate (nicotinamide) nucleotide adenylyltransferase [Acidithiobacillales bacterium]